MDSETDLKGLLKVQDSIWVGQVNLGVDSTQLGVGSDAIVYRTLHDGQNVAAKVLHPILISPGNPGRQEFLERFGEECLRLRQLSHPSVVSFIGVGQAPNKCPCLLIELMEDCLASRINATPPDPFFQTLSYLIDMSAGLRYLHRLRLIHRDLKPHNILITAGSAKIADVGLACTLHGDAQGIMSRCPGTQMYMAPETLDEGVHYDERMDIFSAGVIIVTMFTNQNPAPKAREIVVVDGRRVPTSELVRRRGDIARLDLKHPARPLIFRCIGDDPSSRPSAVVLNQELRRIQHLFVGTDKVVLASEFTDAIARLEANQQQLTETVTRLHTSEQDLASTRQDLASTRQDLASTREELATTQQNMTALASDHAESGTRLTATQQELASTRQDVMRLQDSVQDLVATIHQLTSTERHHLCFDQGKCSRRVTLSDGGTGAKHNGGVKWGNVTTTDGYTTGIRQWQIKILEMGWVFGAGVSVLPQDGEYSTQKMFYGEHYRSYWWYDGNSYRCENGNVAHGERCSKWNEGDVITFVLNCEQGTLEVRSSSSQDSATITGLNLEEPLYPTVCMNDGGKAALR